MREGKRTFQLYVSILNTYWVSFGSFIHTNTPVHHISWLKSFNKNLCSCQCTSVRQYWIKFNIESSLNRKYWNHHATKFSYLMVSLHVKIRNFLFRRIKENRNSCYKNENSKWQFHEQSLNFWRKFFFTSV